MTSVASPSATRAPAYFRGSWLTPGDPGYEEHRRHFNTRFDRRPGAIARCAGVQDVCAALALARAEGLEVAVRSGGRGFGGHSTIDDGLLLDLSPMDDVHVDPVRRSAVVRPGASQGDVLIETVPYGLAPVTGLTSHVGFAGVAIFSGMGHLSPRHGFSCDGVLSAEVVLADGEVVTASPTSHPDLYWAIRGAGDNFGVVVSIETQLHPVPAAATLGLWAWSAEDAAEVMRRHREMDATISDDVFWLAELTVDDAQGGDLRFIVTAVHVGPEAEAAAELAPIDRFGPPPLERSVEPVDWVTLHHAFDDAWPTARQYWAGADLVQLGDPTLKLLLAEGERMAADPQRARLASIVYSRYHGAMLRQVTTPPAAMNRRHGSEITAVAFYDDPSADEHHEAWAESVLDRFRDAGLLYPGATPNYTTRVDVREAWGADYDCLAALKAQYDPDNVFHMNVNIEPATG